MGLKIKPEELRRWEAAGLVPPPKPARCDRPPPPAPGVVLHHHHDDGGPGWRLTLLLPGLKLVSRSNQREHWRVRHARDRAEAAALTAAWIAAGLSGWHPPLPLKVIFTKIGGKLMDDDNLAGAMKAVRDATAKLIGVDDADDRVRWRVRQLAGPEALVRLTLAGGGGPK